MVDEPLLMEWQVAALFRHDQRGRLLATNEPDPPGGAPRLFLGRTRESNVWRFRHDLSDDLVRQADRLLAGEPVGRDLTQPPVSLNAICQLLSEQAPVGQISMGPAWRFPPHLTMPAGVTMITAANTDPLRSHFPLSVVEIAARQPYAAIVRDGVAVAVCFSSRLSPHVAEAGVETLEEFRGQGLAVAVATAWAMAVDKTGRLPLYSTGWANAASRRVAAKLDLMLYGADCSIT